MAFEVIVLPADASAEEAISHKPDAIFLSNGPGDPSALEYAHKTIKKLLPDYPIFGICLGHQVLTHAIGADTYKLKFGHRGGNQPVKNVESEKVSITSQNHGFVVSDDDFPNDLEISHISLFDNTVDGMRSKSQPLFSVQYHPEASAGPHDSSYLFDDFVSMFK